MRMQRLERETVIRWIKNEPMYRVDFWQVRSPSDPAKGVASGYARDSHYVSEADVDEVIAWAHEHANGRGIAIYITAMRDDEPGLIRLLGTDPTAVHV